MSKKIARPRTRSVSKGVQAVVDIFRLQESEEEEDEEDKQVWLRSVKSWCRTEREAKTTSKSMANGLLNGEDGGNGN